MPDSVPLLEAGAIGADRSAPESIPTVLEHHEEGFMRSFRRRVLSVDFSEGSLEDEIEQETLLEKPSLETWEHRLADVWLIARLAVRLYLYLFSGLRWWFKFIRLVLYVVLLLPGFSQMIVFYFFSPRLLRSIVYGTNPRNRLDVYLPRWRYRRRGLCPTIIYITGGAWTIGYKAWGALFGRRLSQRGLLVFCLDYRNFPQGNALDMLQDCNTGIAWVIANCQAFGGDPSNIFLVGQSAGGHLVSLAVLAQAAQQAQQQPPRDDTSHVNNQPAVGGSPSWDPSRIKGFVGVSGAYNLVTLADHLHRRGLYKHMLASIMQGPDGNPWLRELSPTHVVDSLSVEAAEVVPPILLLHGTGDNSVPIDNAEEFFSAATDAGVRITMKRYIGKTHTQPIVEDPMRGGQDELMDEVLSLVRGTPCKNLQFPMQPSFLIDAASFICPF